MGDELPAPQISQVTPKKKKYWSGNTRLLSDIIWCTLLVLIIPRSSEMDRYVDSTTQSGYNLNPQNIIEHLSFLLGSELGCFFLFFFWSWNCDHVKCRAARVTLHLMCWSFLVSCLCVLAFIAYYFSESLHEFTGWYYLIGMGCLGVFVFRKYKAIMWPADALAEIPNKNNTEEN